MGVGAPSEGQCRAELLAVLSSDGFRRSPKLSCLLTYLCEKQFLGLASEITEYSIAMEALGRTAKFDPQQDAVVRVDTYHLRKRLKEYYKSGAGAEHQIQIEIPTGQYAPQFAWRAAPPADEAAPILEPAGSQPGPALGNAVPVRWKLGAVILVLVAVVVALVAPSYRRLLGSPPAKQAAAAIPVGPEEIRIAAGDRASAYVDCAGRTWLPDRYFTGGSAFHRPSVQIQRTRDPELFQSGREGQFMYNIPLHPGVYEVHLYFAETSVASDTLRSINVAVNGQMPANIDVASDAGGVNTATMKILKDISPASDGMLHLAFQGTVPNYLNAIEILPGVRGKMLPVRITAADSAFHDHQGQTWLPDQWGAGGRKSTRVVPITGTSDAGLYQWERIGHFTYAIPVAEGGMYTVVLHFSETWFTAPNAMGGVGSRQFDVYCNGTTLLKNFDILKEAGGVGNQAVIRTFHHVPASPLGKIDLSFAPVVNYALINSIEVIPE